MRARLLPHRNLLLADWLDLRENAQHITCLLRWPVLQSVGVTRSQGPGGECLHYLGLEMGLEVGLEVGLKVVLEVGLTAQRRQRTAPTGV